LGKKTFFNNDIIKEVVEKIIEVCPTFLKKIQHHSGTIMQIARANYSIAREAIKIWGSN
jgi:hypothetical protein